MFRRLYPALVTVVTVTLLVSLVVYSQVRWAETGHGAAASLLYLQNLNLATEGQDYGSISRDVSLFQHLWSMSAQMQIFLGSLLVIAVLGFLVRKRQNLGAVVLHWILVFATAASFAFAVYLHSVDQGWNYYSPLSRFWEVGLGGLFGLWLVSLPIAASMSRLRWPMGAIGVLLIIGTGVFLDGAQQFPGPWTLVPLAGAALVVLAGNPAGPGDAEYRPVGVTFLLETRPFQILGRISYSLYLWHWPLLVLATYWFSSSLLVSEAGSAGITATLGTVRGIAVGSAVIVVSVMLAWLTERYVERPLRQKRKPERSRVLSVTYVRRAVGGSRSVAAAVVVMVVATASVMTFTWAAERWESRESVAFNVDELNRDDYPGPAAFLNDMPVHQNIPVLPDPTIRTQTLPATSVDGCVAERPDTDLILTQGYNSSDVPCEYGDVTSERTMYLVGGSHSEHFLPAMDRVAKERNIRLIPILKLGCVLGLGHEMKWDGQDYPQCAEWDLKAQDFILENPPSDGVVTTVTRPLLSQGRGPDAVPEGYVDVVSRLSEAGIHTWGLRDTPWMNNAQGGDPRTCVAERRYDAAKAMQDCGIERDATLSEVNPAPEAYRDLRFTNIDLSDAFCDSDWCPGMIGNILVYRDNDHLTVPYSLLLAPEIQRQMYGTAVNIR